MAVKCIVCEEKIRFVDDSILVRGGHTRLAYHVYCEKEYKKNPKKYIALGKNFLRLCVVCNREVEYFDNSNKEGLFLHTSCNQKFLKAPEKYSGERSMAIEWKKSLPAIKKPPRPSLTSVLATKTGETLKEKAIQSVVMAKNAAKTSKNIFREADKRAGKIEDIRTEEDAYEFAARDVEEESYKKGLWAKAFSDAEGNEKKQAALYIKYRAEQLIQFLEDLQ